jgi:hypothetical protein
MTLVLTDSVYAATIKVKCPALGGCGTETDCYEAIQDAITNAITNDTIKVYPCSEHYLGGVTISKNLNLIGSGPQKTVITSATTDGIVVNSNVTTTIIGFTITASNRGIYATSGSTTNIRNNVIAGNRSRGIYIHTGLSTITNNVIVDNAAEGILSDDNAASITSKITVSNNIIYHNGGCGVNLNSEVENVSYNDMFANPPGQDICNVGSSTLHFNKSEDPMFIDVSCGNYILQSSSPCKDAGTPGTADLDPDGTQNDMGVYGGPDAAPFWPFPPCAPIITNLTIEPTVVQQGGTISIKATGEVW